MRIDNNDVRASCAAWFVAAGGTTTPMGADDDGPTTGNAHSATHAPDVGAGASKRDRTARSLERRIAWESLLLLGVAVSIALLAIAMWDVADFGARYVARAVATDLVTVRSVRVRPANLARSAHDAPPSEA